MFSGRHAYKPMLEHLACGRGHERRVVRVARAGPKTPPTLTPEQVGLILDACAGWDSAAREWRGSVRDRLLWALLAESGMRLGEALAIKHCDWHAGLGDTPFVEVVPREDHPHGPRVKNGGYRRIYISDELDRLYGAYLEFGWSKTSASSTTTSVRTRRSPEAGRSSATSPTPTRPQTTSTHQCQRAKPCEIP